MKLLSKQKPDIDLFVAIDVETTGVNPFHDDVLAVALAPLRPGVRPKVVYVRPSPDIKRGTDIKWGTDFAKSAFQKYQAEWEAQAVPPREACTRIETYLRGLYKGQKATPVGHNIGFDMAFLRKLAHLSGQDEIAGLSHRAIDTHTFLYALVSRGEIPTKALTSSGAFEEFSVRVPEADRHTALGDAEATRRLFVLASAANDGGRGRRLLRRWYRNVHEHLPQSLATLVRGTGEEPSRRPRSRILENGVNRRDHTTAAE